MAEFIDFRVTGSQRVANGLRRIAADFPEVVEPVVKDHTKALRQKLRRQKYPPKPPASTYQRTGNLSRRFSAQRVRPGVWAIKNSAPYSGYVVDENRQAWMHQNRWWTVQEIEREGRKQLTADLSKELKSYVAN